MDDALLTRESRSAISEVMDRLEIGDEFLWNPDRLVPFEHWIGHIPFAFWLVKILRPRTIVELGTHRGNSYCAFCQAVTTLGLSTRALAVDTWQGDLHMGTEPDLLAELRRYHDPRYGSFSSLLEMTFDEARTRVEPGSVDLLHIDGTHTYDAVRHDFETWRDTVSGRGVVILHDVAVHQKDFGVWRLWNEQSREHRSFAFWHSFGLGVLGLGSELPPALLELFALTDEGSAARRVRALFEARGQGFVARLRAGLLESEQLRLADAVRAAEVVAADRASEISQLETTIAEARDSSDRLAREEARLRSALDAAVQQASVETQQLADALDAAKAGALDAAKRAEEKSSAEISELRAVLHASEAVALGRAKKLDELSVALRASEVIAEESKALAEESKALAEESKALAEQSGAALAEAQDAVRTKDSVIRNLRLELNRLAQSAADAYEHAHATQEQLVRIRSSTLWQATWPVRRALERLPPNARRIGRRSAKFLWWTATLRLPLKLKKARIDRLRVPAPAVIAQGAPVAPTPVRQTGTLRTLFEAQPEQSAARLAAVVHVHYPELWPELRDALSAIAEPFDLFVSVTEGGGDAAISQIRADFPDARIQQIPNHGRDILPFLAFAARGCLDGYRLVCKLHTKRTEYRRDGDAWREALLAGLLRDPQQVQRILTAFDQDPDLGIVVADSQIFGARPEHWVDNRAKILDLGSRIGIVHIPEDACFPGGSMYWIRPFLLRTLTGLELSVADFEPEPLPRDGSTAHAVERLVGLICSEAGMHIRETGLLPPPAAQQVPGQAPRMVAYYLPQYHPTPENDAWWGKGFTEWMNVTRGRPMFRHHRQPRAPSDLGYYDLRVPETRIAQADLARRYGVSGFCYYYYWFDGRGVLRRPLDDLLSSGEPAFPFMICWANEPWTRNWDGGNRELLLAQSYRSGWARMFARDIAPILADSRYIRVGSRPMLLIYRVMHIPNRTDALGELRDELRQAGVGEVHISGGWVGFEGDDEPPKDPRLVGLDTWSEFPPHRLPAAEITEAVGDRDPAFTGKIYSYQSLVDIALRDLRSGERAGSHRAAMMGWDNTARRLFRSHCYQGATPASFRKWLRALVVDAQRRPADDDRLIFVNAWNEWAEGTYLEPDKDFGHGWLEAVASALGTQGSEENRGA